MNINEIANRIFLNFNEEESKKVENEIEILNKEIAVLNDINTDDVLAMDMPFELNENTLRLDEAGPVLTVEELLANAPDASENYVRIVKVVG
ncbi:MAG: hypothetical protein GX074_03810 [Erysipelothrix sp.]|nr:hypothetical protein [Erysipelothrix sp.]